MGNVTRIVYYDKDITRGHRVAHEDRGGHGGETRQNDLYIEMSTVSAVFTRRTRITPRGDNATCSSLSTYSSLLDGYSAWCGAI